MSRVQGGRDGTLGHLMADIPEVLFVCTHNAGRSQMAAALLARQAAGRIKVTSAGSSRLASSTPP